MDRNSCELLEISFKGFTPKSSRLRMSSLSGFTCGDFPSLYIKVESERELAHTQIHTQQGYYYFPQVECRPRVENAFKDDFIIST